MNKYVIAALYKFVELPDFKDLQEPLKRLCLKEDIRGTLLLAEEGINGTISGTRLGIDAVLSHLSSDSRMKDLKHKESYAKSLPFRQIKIRLKKEIVTLGIPKINPNKLVGQYVKAKNWNELISCPEVIVIDTRNDYEVEIGTFKKAKNPKNKYFREFPQYVKNNFDPSVHKKVALFCTGGIRCEKASSYMLTQGFKEVYHLQGGILKYLETIPKNKSFWEGECFVFDNRVTVNHSIEQGSYDQCFGCRHPVPETDKMSKYYKLGVFCPKCYNSRSDQQKARAHERQRQIQIAKLRNKTHISISQKS